MAHPTDAANSAEASSAQPVQDHGHVPVMRERMAELLAPAIDASVALEFLSTAPWVQAGTRNFFSSSFPSCA